MIISSQDLTLRHRHSGCEGVLLDFRNNSQCIGLDDLINRIRLINALLYKRFYQNQIGRDTVIC